VTDWQYLDEYDLQVVAEYALQGQQPLYRDPGALAAAAERPRTAVFGMVAYPTLETKAAALLHSIVRNHPLVDGNKRLGWTATVLFCRMNGADFHVLDAARAEAFVLSVADGTLDVDEAAKFIAAHLVAIPHLPEIADLPE